MKTIATLTRFLIVLIVLVIIYMSFALLNYDGGVDSFTGLIIFQPIFATVISLSTILLVFLVGLPLRSIEFLLKWWKRNYQIAYIIIIVSIVFLILSIFPSLRQEKILLINEVETIKLVPNFILVATGWFLIAFSLLHLHIPFKKK